MWRTSLATTFAVIAPLMNTTSRRLLPRSALAPVRRWLDDLAADAQARGALVRRTLRGALASLPARSAVVERAAMEQLTAAEELRAEKDLAYSDALREVETALRSGALLRGEVLARWHEVVGTGDLMRQLESRLSRLRDRVRSAFTGGPAPEAGLQEAMRVTEMDDYWLEQPVRERRWFGFEEALTLIGRKEIQPMIAKLGGMLGVKKSDGH